MQYFVQEPRVSVVIINWNYGRFIADTIQSVKDQSYQNFECIVVDNGSDDDSVERTAEAIRGHPQFALHRLPANLGQLGAGVWSLQHLTGEFVAFVDADDVLAPTYLASHLQVHLAASSGVGFTSSNCVDVNSDGALLTGGQHFMYQCWQEAAPALRPSERTVRLRVVDDEAYSALAQASRYLEAYRPYWCWWPGSSNMFRRALLDRVRPTDSSQAMFGGVDSFYTPIFHALTGTVLIDQPLSAYRVHGSNDFSVFPSIRGVRSQNAKTESQSFASFLRVLRWLVDGVDDVLVVVSLSRYWRILDTVMTTFPRPDALSHPELKAAWSRQYPRLVELFGKSGLYRELRGRMRFFDYLDIVRGAHGGTLGAAEFADAWRREIKRGFRRLRGKTV